MDASKLAIRLFLLGFLAALSGCLVSEEPLLDARSGRATPIAPGLYEACEIDADRSSHDCETMEVMRDDSALYSFILREDGEEEETTRARFRRLGSGAWLAQLYGDEDEDYFYFLAEAVAGDFVMAMIVCEDIPAATRAKYVGRGEMEVDESASACVVSSLRAAIAAAKAYRSAIPMESRSRIVYRKLAGAKE